MFEMVEGFVAVAKTSHKSTILLSQCINVHNEFAWNAPNKQTAGW